jgi:hypothetical protein
MRKFQTAPLLSLAVLFLPTLGEASQSVNLLHEGLSIVAGLSSIEPNDRLTACAQLDTLRVQLTPVIGSFPQLRHLYTSLPELKERFCTSDVPSDTIREFSSQAGTPQAPTLPPNCNTGIGPIPNCTFNEENGRGLFTMGQTAFQKKPNFLVCVMSAGAGSWMLHSDYIIKGRCLVSGIDWKDTPPRSDVDGVFNWLEASAHRSPIALPQPLSEQCRQAFPEAAFCSPSMVVLPTRDTNVFDICSLHSHQNQWNVVLFRINNSNSHWDCETKDLRVVDQQIEFGGRDWECVPNVVGHVNNRCILPFVPTTEEVMIYDPEG